MTTTRNAILEFTGLVLVAVSLLFVAFQMNQEHAIAEAELNTSQLQLYQGRLIAELESEPYLSM